MTIDLTDDEALVLFELLSTYGSDDAGRKLVVEHAGERNALWALSAQLEKRVAVSLQHDYADLVSAARVRMEERGGTW